MPYVSPATVTTLTPITSTWGNSVKAATDFLSNQPSCHLTRSSDQAIPHLTITNVLWNVEQYDTDGMHSTSSQTDRITIKTAGVYVVTANVLWGADTDWIFAASWIQLNGATNLACSMVGAFNDGAIGAANSLSIVRKFAVNDYLSVAVYEKNSSAGANIVTLASNFAAAMLGTG